MATAHQSTFRGQTTTRIIVLVAIALIVTGTSLHAQNPNPFGQPGVKPAPAPNPLQPAPLPSVLPTPEPLVVRLVRESNPSTPLELTRAVQLMIQTSQLKEAKSYLQQLVALKMTPQEKAELQLKFGTGLFLQFSREPDLQPEGAQVAEAVAEAAYRAAQDPNRITSLIAKLSDPSVEVRLVAMEDLRPSGTAAVTALADLLGDKQRSAEQPTIRAALLKFQSIAHEPLIGYLDSENTNSLQQKEIVDLLGQLGHPRSTLYLVRLAVLGEPDSLLLNSAQRALQRLTGAVPNQQDAEAYLRRMLREFRQGTVPVQADADGRITLWQWNGQKKTSAPISYRADLAAVVLSAQVAANLYALDQQNRQYQLWYISHILAASKQLGGLNKPLSLQAGGAAEIASKAGPVVVHEVFQQALETNQVAAAIAAAEVLAKIGSPILLDSLSGKHAPLIQALFHANRRLRFTALETILKLDPQASYPGSTHVSDALGYFAASRGRRTAFVGHPLPARGQFITGLLHQAGYHAEKVLVGKSLIELVRKQTDCDLVLISETISSPTIGEIIQRFRDDPRTASISIGILANPENLLRVKMLATMDPLTEVVGRPHTVENLAFYLARLEHLRSRHHVGVEERIAQARKALQWATQLMEKSDQYSFYNLFRQEPAFITAVSVSSLTRYASPVLGFTGTAKAQKALVNTASRNSLDLVSRQSAAEAFDRAVRKRRVMLTQQDILRQYDRYNASETLDKQTQQVLGGILDSIERRALLDSDTSTNKEGN